MNYHHPRLSKNIYGHDNAIAQFLDAFRSNRLHHAWLLTGQKGIGKATLAYHIAKFLLSNNADKDAHSLTCNEVTASQVDHGSHPDISIVQDFSENDYYKSSEIKVDEVRTILSALHMTPVLSKNKIVLIDGVDSLNINAANALLKALEEPTKNTYFFLAANNPGKLLPTIRSRCRVLNLHNLAIEDFSKAAADLSINSIDVDFLYDFTAGSLYFSQLLYSSANFDQIRQIFSSSSIENIIKDMPKLTAFQFEQSHIQFIMERFFSSLIKAKMGDAVKIAALFQWRDEFVNMMKETTIFNLDWKNVYITALEKLPS